MFFSEIFRTMQSKWVHFLQWMSHIRIWKYFTICATNLNAFEHIREHVVDIFNIQTFKATATFSVSYPIYHCFLALSLPSQAVSIYLTADKMVMNWSKEINCYFCKTCALHKRAKEHMLCSFCPYFFNASFFSHLRLSEYIWHRIE